MLKYIMSSLVLSTLLLLLNCSKKQSTEPANLTSSVVSNLSTVSAGYFPASLASNSATSVSAQADPCEGVTDFAVCQSNLIRAYLQLGKDTVSYLSQVAGTIGKTLGEIPNGNAGTSVDGKISWNKTSGEAWSVLQRGLNGATLAYISINNGVYTLKADLNQAESNAQNKQFEATVTYTDEDTWIVDAFFSNAICSASSPNDPSKVHIRISKSNGLWKGKAMLYFPRWKAPSVTVDCSTAPAPTIVMYTDFVGNDISTKAALYLIPPTESGNLSNASTFSVPNFCTNFASHCGGGGQPTAGALAAYPNNWCTTGVGTNPQWGNNCSTNPSVVGASFSSASDWTIPSNLVIKTVSMPTSL